MTSKYYYGMTESSDSGSGQGVPMVYETVPVNDPGFVELMDKQGVDYSAVIQQEPVLMNFILSWVLPFAFIYLIWKLMAKRWAARAPEL